MPLRSTLNPRPHAGARMEVRSLSERVVIEGFKDNFVNRMTADEIMSLLHRTLADAGFECFGSNLRFQAEETLETLVFEVEDRG